MYRKLAIVALGLIAAAALTVAETNENVLKVGDNAPGFMLRDINGVMVSLRRLCGKTCIPDQRKIVVLDFFQVTCKPCIEELPAIKRFFETWKNENRVAFYMVGVGESPDRLQKFRDEHDAHQLPMLSDPYFVCCKSFGVNAFPVAMIIDREGIVRLVIKNKQPEIDKILAENIKKML